MTDCNYLYLWGLTCTNAAGVFGNLRGTGPDSPSRGALVEHLFPPRFGPIRTPSPSHWPDLGRPREVAPPPTLGGPRRTSEGPRSEVGDLPPSARPPRREVVTLAARLAEVGTLGAAPSHPRREVAPPPTLPTSRRAHPPEVVTLPRVGTLPSAATLGASRGWHPPEVGTRAARPPSRGREDSHAPTLGAERAHPRHPRRA